MIIPASRRRKNDRPGPEDPAFADEAAAADAFVVAVTDSDLVKYEE